MSKRKGDTRGPVGYENWQIAREQQPLIEIFEVPLYSDAPLFGAIQAGTAMPYELIGVGGLRDLDGLAHQFTARICWHVDMIAQRIDLNTKDVSGYHGAGPADELAALLSLLMGSRLRAGGTTRLITAGDRHGHPSADRNRPALLLRQSESGGWRIPRALQQRSVSDVQQLFNTYPDLKPTDASALARAARLYQNALWIAEADPSSAWFFLVSAIEAGAKPSRKAGATKAFLQFTQKHGPGEPSRPEGPRWSLIDWANAEGLRKRLDGVYKHRCALAHEGIPFPDPMCEAIGGPFRHYEEYPSESAVHAHGGTWTQNDLPMLLHVFEHIVRGCLTNWWRSLIQTDGP